MITVRIFGSTAKPVAAVGQGSWRSDEGAAQAVAALRRGLDLGLTHIDTAEMQERYIEEAVIPWCAAHGAAVVAYTPFGETPGIFSTRSRQGAVLHEIAAAHDASARQVALAFLLRHPNVFVIPKASGIEHVADNAAAAGLVLDAAAMARIEAAFPRATRRGLPMI